MKLVINPRHSVELVDGVEVEIPGDLAAQIREAEALAKGVPE